jgi:homocysteine S-methyltransferase
VFDPDQLLAFLEELDRREIRIPVVPGIWPLVSLRNAEFLANEVPGITVPERIVDRMRRAQERGKEHAVQEGIAIAREAFDAVRSEARGLQVSAPFGRVDLALEVMAGLEGITPEAADDEPGDGVPDLSLPVFRSPGSGR